MATFWDKLRGAKSIDQAWFVGRSRGHRYIPLPGVFPICDKGWALLCISAVTVFAAGYLEVHDFLGTTTSMILVFIGSGIFFRFALPKVYWMSEQETEQFKRSYFGK